MLVVAAPAQPLPATAGAVPPPSGAAYLPPPRVASNIKLLGILWLIHAGLHLIPGLILFTVFAGAATVLPPDVPLFVHSILAFIGLALCAISAVGLVAGWGLLTWKNWARILTIVLGVLNLINFPFGTALGIYTLWVLLPAESEKEFQQHAAVMGGGTF
ncbi:MAG TPA: hypothetical protein VH351_22090 [Bryobacteraceae bacterium]|jgi:hypothetical protein|nr:hypothetical protein [Bryobacteraceae bacterium]